MCGVYGARRMMKCLSKIKNFFKRSSMTEFEVYLSQATDIVDLENRMKYGYRNRNFNTQYDSIKSNSLFYVRGF